VIDYLDTQAVIAPESVGIVGFSRTVCYVAYTLTHSKRSFAAASFIDGIDCGYFQEIAYPDTSWDQSDLLSLA
jgi:dienelactone hydrolase